MSGNLSINNANREYDVIIIGSGIAGIFAGYELVSKNRNLRVALLEQGNDILKRSCPIVDKKTDSCINCTSCAIMRGFGGAGAFSDGKFNFTTEFRRLAVRLFIRRDSDGDDRICRFHQC
jgi:uncharacterized FAD-dependent dehydrogenase